MGIEENAGKPEFSSFPAMFSTLLNKEILIVATLYLSSANALNLVNAKILSTRRLTEHRSYMTEGKVKEKLKMSSATGDHSFMNGCFPILTQYLTTALERIFFSSVVMVLAFGALVRILPRLYI